LAEFSQGNIRLCDPIAFGFINGEVFFYLSFARLSSKLFWQCNVPLFVAGEPETRSTQDPSPSRLVVAVIGEYFGTIQRA